MGGRGAGGGGKGGGGGGGGSRLSQLRELRSKETELASLRNDLTKTNQNISVYDRRAMIRKRVSLERRVSALRTQLDKPSGN